MSSKSGTLWACDLSNGECPEFQLSLWQFLLASPALLSQDAAADWIQFGMKAKIIITPKKAVLDPQGKTVQSALAHIGYSGIGDVRVGKYLEIELANGDRDAARRQIDEACHKILSNPVIEDYRFEIE